MTKDMEMAGAECVNELAVALLVAAGAVMKRHGNDPSGPAIVAAGFAMAIQRIGTEVNETVPIIVREMLARETS